MSQHGAIQYGGRRIHSLYNLCSKKTIMSLWAEEVQTPASGLLRMARTRIPSCSDAFVKPWMGSALHIGTKLFWFQSQKSKLIAHKGKVLTARDAGDRHRLEWWTHDGMPMPIMPLVEHLGSTNLGAPRSYSCLSAKSLCSWSCNNHFTHHHFPLGNLLSSTCAFW